MNYLSFQNYLYIMKSTFKKKSLNRILQEIYVQKKIANGIVIEFGSQFNSSKNFTNFIQYKNLKKIIHSDKFPKNNNTREEDLESIISLEDNSIDTVLIFNVLEHIFDVKNAFLEINRCLKKNSGKIIGSTPFIHRVHGAPNDYNRYTKQFIEKILDQNNYKNIEVENLGFGPFSSAYTMLFDYFKLIPFLNNFILTICMILDKIINLCVKTNTKNIYPVTVCFSGEKK
jgi:SAM-dependent methyltransferase